MAARGDDLAELMTIAARVRDAGLVKAGRPGVVTYSRKVFIPLTRLCRDRCHYCTFATVPGPAAAAVPRHRRGRGDRPPRARRWAARRRCSPSATGPRSAGRRPGRGSTSAGYDSTLAYVRAAAIAVLEETGLLPHLNPGVMSWDRAAAPQAGRAEHGDDARDHVAAALRRAGRRPLRQPRQGPRRPAAGARGRRPALDPVHHRHPGRHRREPDRAGRVDLRDPPDGPRVRLRSRR